VDHPGLVHFSPTRALAPRSTRVLIEKLRVNGRAEILPTPASCRPEARAMSEKAERTKNDNQPTFEADALKLA
jgi:hypothetical protein